MGKDWIQVLWRAYVFKSVTTDLNTRPPKLVRVRVSQGTGFAGEIQDQLPATSIFKKCVTETFIFLYSPEKVIIKSLGNRFFTAK